MEKELIQAQKAQLRKEIKQQLSAFCANTQLRADADKKAASVFLTSNFYKNSSFLFCFISSKNEISTIKIIQTALKDGKTVVVPKVRIEQFEKNDGLSKNLNSMDFYFLQNEPLENQTEIGAYGIVEPKSTLEKLNIIDIPENALMLLPGLGFSLDGTRLGKGKGFYDIYLNNSQNENLIFARTVKKIGFCYNIQVKKIIPQNSYDIKVDCVITEKGILFT